MSNTKEEILKIEFLCDYEVQDEHAGTNQATRFKAGAKRVMPFASAMHYVNRSVAKLV